jgi:hypothetical protein
MFRVSSGLFLRKISGTVLTAHVFFCEWGARFDEQNRQEACYVERYGEGVRDCHMKRRCQLLLTKFDQREEKIWHWKMKCGIDSTGAPHGQEEVGEKLKRCWFEFKKQWLVMIWVVVALVLRLRSAFVDHMAKKQAFAREFVDKEDHSSLQTFHSFVLIICFTWFGEEGTEKVKKWEGDWAQERAKSRSWDFALEIVKIWQKLPNDVKTTRLLASSP